jgi:hypothetical protein
MSLDRRAPLDDLMTSAALEGRVPDDGVTARQCHRDGRGEYGPKWLAIRPTHRGGTRPRRRIAGSRGRAVRALGSQGAPRGWLQLGGSSTLPWRTFPRRQAPGHPLPSKSTGLRCGNISSGSTTGGHELYTTAWRSRGPCAQSHGFIRAAPRRRSRLAKARSSRESCSNLRDCRCCCRPLSTLLNVMVALDGRHAVVRCDACRPSTTSAQPGHHRGADGVVG